jgi:KaiC/GvpD/RAD55 family RecA-like ATPase
MKTKSKAGERKPAKVAIGTLPTGVRGLDDILGGGIPEFSFNVIAGMPGCGKTTMAHQIMFANATVKSPALYFTVLGEPALKMLRYQQQFSFFDEAKIGKAIRFINLSDRVLEEDLDAVLAEIVQQVTAVRPGIVVVDSFRTVMRTAMAAAGEMAMQSFIQRLTQFLTSWQATTFLVGEYGDEETRGNPLFTVADGLFWLSQKVERNSVVRKLQILKVRGQESVPSALPMAANSERHLAIEPKSRAMASPSAPVGSPPPPSPRLSKKTSCRIIELVAISSSRFSPLSRKPGAVAGSRAASSPRIAFSRRTAPP